MDKRPKVSKKERQKTLDILYRILCCTTETQPPRKPMGKSPAPVLQITAQQKRA